MVSVGLVGCGTIGSGLAAAIERKYRRAARIVALHDQNHANALRVQRRIRSTPPICSLATLIRRSRLVIEAASVEVVVQVVRAALRADRDVLVMSVGGLLLNRSWQRLAQRSRARLYVPSGALAGLDGVKGMAMGRIRRISLTTRKPPRSLRDAPSVRRKGLNLSRRRRPVTVFEGSAHAAVRALPQNANVAASLALASGRPTGRVRVRVIADPTIRSNIHEVEVIGDRGRLHARMESAPSRSNPRTSEQALRSALATLDQILGPITIGT